MPTFNGFAPETIQFFKDLRENNSKSWFEQNRDIYESYVLKPAQDFVSSMGSLLEEIAPEIVAIPKIDKSIFRIHRDTRFSKNKSPYKTNLAFFFWEGSGKKLENPGFYLHMEPEKLFLGVGVHEFSKDMIHRYRESVIDSEAGPRLVSAINKVQKHGKYTLGWKKYKKTPRGYDSNHERAELLQYAGIGFHHEEEVSDKIYQPDFLNYCFEMFRDMSAIHFWLKNL